MIFFSSFFLRYLSHNCLCLSQTKHSTLNIHTEHTKILKAFNGNGEKKTEKKRTNRTGKKKNLDQFPFIVVVDINIIIDLQLRL